MAGANSDSHTFQFQFQFQFQVRVRVRVREGALVDVLKLAVNIDNAWRYHRNPDAVSYTHLRAHET